VPRIPAGERKRLVMGPLQGEAYQASRRALFTRDDLQRQLQNQKTNTHKVWPPALPQDADASRSPEQKPRKYQSKLLQEMHETMGPYLDKTCVRTPTGDDKNNMARLDKSWPGASASLSSPGMRLQVRKHDSPNRPPTREYHKQLLQQIEHRISDYEDFCSSGTRSAQRGLGRRDDASSAMEHLSSEEQRYECRILAQGRLDFERGLTPKLVREGMRSRSTLAASTRSRSVMGTSDSGWPRYRGSTVINGDP
jgi:hypothetical protein